MCFPTLPHPVRQFAGCSLVWLSIVSGLQGADVNELIARLAAAGAGERQAAADGLADLGYAAQPAVPQLIKTLTAAEPEVRWRAARALGVIGDPQAIAHLRQSTKDDDAIVRAQAIFALGRLKSADEESIRVIVERLGDNDAQVRRATVRAIRMMEAPRALVGPLVVKLLNDADPTIAMRALSSISEGGVEVVPALTEALKQPEARYWAALALGEMGPQAKNAVSELIQVLGDDRPEVRLQATIALGEIGPDAKPAVGELIKLMADPFEAVRAAAMFALGRIGDAAAVNALVEVESSTDPMQRMLAAWALAKLHKNDPQRLNQALERLVQGLTDKNREMNDMAAKALADLEVDPAKVRPLIDKLVAANPDIPDRLLTAFSSQGTRAIPAAIEALRDPQRRVRALQILSRIGPEAATAVPAIVDLLKAGDAPTRTEALYAIGAIGEAAHAAVPLVVNQLNDTDPRVAEAAVYALGKMGPKAGAAVPILSKLTQSQDEFLRMTSVWAILRIGPRTPELLRQAVPVLTQGLKNSREYVRLEAAMALGEIGPAATEAVPALQEARNDSSAAVRSAAAAAMKKIKG